MGKCKLGAVARAFDRAVESYEVAAKVQQMMAKNLAEIVPEGKAFARAFEFGVGTGFLTCELLRRCRIDTLLLNDLSPKMLEAVKARIAKLLQAERLHTSGLQIELLSGDVEALPNSAYRGVDLIASSSALQWLTAPFLFLEKATKALRPGGTLLIATFGSENLREVRELTGNGLNYPSEEAYRYFYREHGFEAFICREEHLALHFPNAREVLRHLKATGVTQLPQQADRMKKRLEGRKAIDDFCRAYETRCTSEEGVSLSYHPILLYGRKKQ